MRKKTVEECKVFSIYDLNKNKYFNGKPEGIWTYPNGFELYVQVQNVEEPYVIFIYKRNGYRMLRFRLFKQECYFGGFRYWFLCQNNIGGNPCNKVSAKLYLPYDQNEFACRKCHSLSYDSKNNSKNWYGILLRHTRLIQKFKNVVSGKRVYFRKNSPTRSYKILEKIGKKIHMHREDLDKVNDKFLLNISNSEKIKKSNKYS